MNESLKLQYDKPTIEQAAPNESPISPNEDSKTSPIKTDDKSKPDSKSDNDTKTQVVSHRTIFGKPLV